MVVLATAANSLNMNLIRIPPRVRFVRESERIQIESSQSLAQDMYNECLSPTSPSNDSLNPDHDDDDFANSRAALGFDYLPRGPAQSLVLKCTNPQQLEIGSCYF